MKLISLQSSHIRLFFNDDKILNLGDITKVDVKNIPDCDLFTYSFPCQDISVAGKLKGLDKNSNTRSGLLWDVRK
ncbi:DNA cytosine methyltransferase [Peptostreptococcus anaerobius]|uniref:DNA cytosine methyltransferase n=1 Tax=Peptostreptococcus anaerobius TaxID=1261 RepID=UPI000E1B8B06